MHELLEAFESSFGDDARQHTPKQSGWLDGVKDFWARVTS